MAYTTVAPGTEVPEGEYLQLSQDLTTLTVGKPEVKDEVENTTD